MSAKAMGGVFIGGFLAVMLQQPYMRYNGQSGQEPAELKFRSGGKLGDFVSNLTFGNGRH